MNERIQHAFATAVSQLLSERNSRGHWTGELSSSALSTATAISALAAYENWRADHHEFTSESVDRLGDRRELIESGLRWLADRQNADGGWGDTELSYSNISTTMLTMAAFRLAGRYGDASDLMQRADAYVEACGGIDGLRKRYGKDKTFAVPILANCAIAGQVAWRNVSPLPFEAAWVPQSLYRWMQMPVVSYAIPALVAIGQARFHHAPPWNPLVRMLRKLAVRPTLEVLKRMQPASGGYLEAIPLTCFVAMGLISAGKAEHPVVENALRFVFSSLREDGSWPIDTNLATWNTTLAINAISPGLESSNDSNVVELASTALSDSSQTGSHAAAALREEALLEWLLDCQYQEVHPFTGAKPGGWGWSDLSGAVPDADDTPGALLALSELRRIGAISARSEHRVEAAVRHGITWLLGLQNSDGGWPTFCRGWGKLPFDRSGADLTAHAIRAVHAWKDVVDRQPELQTRVEKAVAKGFEYLGREQLATGAWRPLWFGNQDAEEEENLVYGTAKVLFAYRDMGMLETVQAKRGLIWLTQAQNGDGGWGGGPAIISGFNAANNDACSGDQTFATAGRAEAVGGPTASSGDSQQESAEGVNPVLQEAVKGNAATVESGLLESSVEETALAVEALLAYCGKNTAASDDSSSVVGQGVKWLVQAVESGRYRQVAPIGFYFAKLWYHERLYPQLFCVGALARVWRLQGESRDAIGTYLAKRASD